MTASTTFTPATYSFGWVCDADLRTEVQVVKRTTKRVTFTLNGETKTVALHVDDDGREFFFPSGRYSMAPVCRADQRVA